VLNLSIEISSDIVRHDIEAADAALENRILEK